MGHLKTGGRPDADATHQPTSELDAWNAGIASVLAAPAPVVDARIPGVAPDVSAIAPWVDTVPAKSAAAPAKPASRNEALVDMQATAHAAALTLTRHTTNDPQARWKFLNTLDRIDDPVLRAKTLQQFQAQTGMPLQVFIDNTEWHSDRDQEQALALISPERGAAERDLQALSPEDRKKLSAKANDWSQQILHVTRATDADTDDNGPKVANALRSRTPVEMEAIRASVRYNTRDKSLYQEIDRSLSGGNEDEALAGTTGNAVFAASVGIANADGNAQRIKEIVGGLSDAQRAGLVLSHGAHGTSAITRSVHESQRGEVQQLLAGRDDAADGAHFADLFKDPKAGMEFEGTQPTEQSQQNFKARQPENVIAELRSKSPEQIEAARTAWDKANPGRSWGQMIQERFGSGDPTTFLRINALAHGNKVEERAYALRDGIRKNNQAQVEAALENPDLTSSDPEKVAAAQAEKLALQARVRDLDALGQRATAMMMGQDPAQAAGRDLDAQLTDHYQDAVAKNPHTMDLAELLVLGADPEGSKAKRQLRAGEDKYATDELKTGGKLSTTTEIRRAETKGDTQRKAELLENLEDGSELSNVKIEFQKRYSKDPLAEPDLAEIDSTSAFLKSTGDSRPLSEIKASVADEMQSSNELRIEHVRRYGVKSERTEYLQHILQKDVFAKQHTDSHEEFEQQRERYGFNIGTNDLVRSQLANQDELFTKPAGPYGTGTRGLKADVDREQFTQGDQALTKSLDVQRAEKIKHAEQLASTFVTIAKIGALLVAQPGLVMLIDLAANLGGMAIKQSAGGSDVDVSTDMAMMAVDAIADGLGVGAARLGGKAISTERATQSALQLSEKTAANIVEHGVTTEAKSEIVGAGARAAAGESSVLAGSGAHLAKAETGALALPHGTLASKGVAAGTTSVGHGRLVANMGVNSFGSVLGGAVQGQSSDDLLIGLARMLTGALLPGRLATSMQKAIGTGSKTQRVAGTLIGGAADVGTSAAISGSAVDALGNRLQHHVGGHAIHHDDARYAPTRRYDDSPNPLAHWADEPNHHPVRHNDASDARDVADSSHTNPGVASTKPQQDANDHKRVLAEKMQKLANAERAQAMALKQEIFTELDQLAGLATTAEDWAFIRKLEHDAKRPVSERYSPHDELAALQQYERAGGLHHADGTPMTPDEAKVWIAQAKGEFQDGIDTKTAAHRAAVAELTGELRGRVAKRDAAKTKELADAARAAPLDDQGRRVVAVDEAISLGMGGAGSAGAKHGHTDDSGHLITRTDRMGIEDATKPELWGTLGTKAAGQEANAVSYGKDGIRTKDVAEHATAQVARASELALQVAAQRNDSQVGTIGSNGPIGELQIKNVKLPDGRQVLEVGVPVKIKIDGVEQVVVVTTIKGVDISSGLGQARHLTTDETEAPGRPKQLDAAYANKLKDAEALMTGEQALAKEPSHFKEKRVLGIGGGPTSEWVAEHALHGEAASVEVVGTMPRPHKNSPEGIALIALETEIRTLATSGQDVPPAMTLQHQQIVDAHVDSQLQRLAELDTQIAELDAQLKVDPKAKGMRRERENAMAEQARIKSDIDPFLGSRVDRNHATLNNNQIKHGQADVMLMKPSTDGGVEVIFTDGTRTVVDQVVPSIGVDHDAPGGIDFMLKALPKEAKMIPVIAQGRVVGLESNPPGLSISGAALTGSTGLNMPKRLLSRIPPNMRDAFMTSVVDHAIREGVSDGSKGIIPGIENVGQNPALMQEVLALPPAERAAELQEFLKAHQKTRDEQFDHQARFRL